MANPEHEAILQQGVEVWNQWRKENPNVRPDFNKSEIWLGGNLYEANLLGADLFGLDLRGGDLRRADLRGADLRDSDLRKTNLYEANLSLADLREAWLQEAILSGANFHQSDLREAILSGANLSMASLFRANLANAILYEVSLDMADFTNTDLSGSDFSKSICGSTIFADIDLSKTKGLDTVDHHSPSTLGVDTIFRSKGKIPEVFLRGCGVPETLITFLPSMMEQAIMFYSCFISYSHEDKAFAQRLHDRLQGVGIRCWLDEHQLKPGDELHKTIYEGIRVYDKVILCCSETALKSWWVEKEFKNAITKEEDYTETVLIPITLDDYLFKQSKESWTIGEINRRFVGDFSGWRDHDTFESAFKKVVDALRTDGGKQPPPTPKLTPRK